MEIQQELMMADDWWLINEAINLEILVNLTAYRDHIPHEDVQNIKKPFVGREFEEERWVHTEKNAGTKLVCPKFWAPQLTVHFFIPKSLFPYHLYRPFLMSREILPNKNHSFLLPQKIEDQQKTPTSWE